MGQPVVHFEVQGNDREALSRFYGQLFDWKTNDIAEMNYTMVEKGGDGGINGGIGTTPEGAPGGVTFYVGSDDVAGSLKRAEELGGRAVAGPMDMPDGNKWPCSRTLKGTWLASMGAVSVSATLTGCPP